MSKLKFLLIAATALLLNSCSSVQERIMGTWYVTKICYAPNACYPDEPNVKTYLEFPEEDFYIFKEVNTYSQTETVIMQGYYDIQDKTLRLYQGSAAASCVLTYKIEELSDKLVLKMQSSTTQCFGIGMEFYCEREE